MMMNNKEQILLSFWLPFRKSNFLNLIDKNNQDNLVYKFMDFGLEYKLNIDKFDINLTKSLYNSIFKLRGNSALSKQNIYVKKHLNGSKNKYIVSGGDTETRETLISYRYIITNKHYKTNSININFSKTAISDISHFHLKFKFTKESIEIFKQLDMFKSIKNRGLFFISLIDRDIDLYVDEYGFYYINLEITKPIYYDIDYDFRQLFTELFFSLKREFTILTFDQKHIIVDGLLFEYDFDNKIQDNIEEKDGKNNIEEENRIEDFFKKIIKVYHFNHFKEAENFDIVPNSEVKYILDSRNDNELKNRIYNIPFINYCYENAVNSKNILKEHILNTDKYIYDSKIEFLYKLFLQDKIEKNAMNRFLDVSTSITYIGQIINQIKDARDNLRALINDTTETGNNLEEDISNRIHRTEEELSRYIEKIFSKIPNLKTIDTFLQESYYIKIGNYSFIGFIENSESIFSVHQYIKWKNLLDNIDNTALSLQTILQVYQSRQSIEELEELRINELSSSDKNDVKNIVTSDRQSFILDSREKDFLVILGLFIAFSDFYKDLWNNILDVFNNLTNNNIMSIILSICSAILILYVFSRFLPYITRIILDKKDEKPLIFSGINTIELRSKKKLNVKIKHENDHNFTRNIESVIKHIEDNISNEYHNLLNNAKRRVLFTRVNPRKRTIRIKYIFDEYKNKDYYSMAQIDINKSKSIDKKIKIKFFVVYNFSIKLINKGNEDCFELYNNSAKIYFNLATKNSTIKNDIKKEYEDLIRQKLYTIFLQGLNS